MVMMGRRILKRLQAGVQRRVRTIGDVLARLTRPRYAVPVLSTGTDLARSKPQLVAENLLVRQQRTVLNRSGKRPRFTRAERGRCGLLASRLQGWQQALLIGKPATVLRWHREGFRLFW
jgi:putative transposase